MFDEEAMRELLQKKGLTISKWAQFLGISRPTLYRKMRGKSDFWREEILKTCDFVGESNLDSIFFAK